MQKRFAQTINEMRGLINEWSAPVLLAVSGGVDSICMAEMFAALEHPVDFAIAHCNFCLRGSESDGDQRLVQDWSEAHGVMFHTVSFDTASYAKEHGVSIEMAARELRYGWFADLCRQYGYKTVAVAHNANDNAETLILNLVRGTGLKGIGGMALLSDLPCCGVKGLNLIRPMLAFTRKQIEGYAFAEKIKYREDSTNSSVEYRRNSIRHEIFPVMQRLNPSFIRTMNREMGYFAEAEDIVDDYCSAVIPDIMSSDGPEVAKISMEGLMGRKHWRYLLFRMLEPYGFSSAVLESLEALLQSDRTRSGKRFESAGYVLFTERDRIVIDQKNTAVPDSEVEVTGPGLYEFNGMEIVVEQLDWDSSMPFKQPDGTVIMDASKLAFPFIFRSWRQGDWMIPFGMKGKKKISDLFADLKYGHREKQQAVMVVPDTSGEHVAALAGVRIDNGVKVGNNTESIIRITLRTDNQL